MVYYTTVRVLLLTAGIYQLASGACDIYNVGQRTCPTNYSHVSKGNKCLMLTLSQGQQHYQDVGINNCLKANGYLVTIKTKEEDDGVMDFLLQKLPRNQAREHYWIGIANDKYIDNTPFDSNTNYQNFGAGSKEDCVAKGKLQGKWKYFDCGATISGSICETFPQLKPQRPTISVSGVTITGGEMRVTEQQKIIVNCKAKFGTQGKLNFVSHFQNQAFIIHEYKHLRVQRRQATEVLGGKCFKVGYAQMTFYVLRDMADHTIGCISQNVSKWNWRCTQWDPYCQLLPAVFKFPSPQPGQPAATGPLPDTFPAVNRYLPQVPTIPPDPSFFQGVTSPTQSTQSPPDDGPTYTLTEIFQPFIFLIILVCGSLLIFIIVKKALSLRSKDILGEGEHGMEQMMVYDIDDEMQSSSGVDKPSSSRSGRGMSNTLTSMVTAEESIPYNSGGSDI